MATRIKMSKEFDYEYFSGQPPLEVQLMVEIPYKDIDKMSIAKFASVITGYSRAEKDGYIIVRIMEHQEMHWKLLHDFLTPEQTKEIKEFAK